MVGARQTPCLKDAKLTWSTRQVGLLQSLCRRYMTIPCKGLFIWIRPRTILISREKQLTSYLCCSRRYRLRFFGSRRESVIGYLCFLKCSVVCMQGKPGPVGAHRSRGRALRVDSMWGTGAERAAGDRTCQSGQLTGPETFQLWTRRCPHPAGDAALPIELSCFLWRWEARQERWYSPST